MHIHDLSTGQIVNKYASSDLAVINTVQEMYVPFPFDPSVAVALTIVRTYRSPAQSHNALFTTGSQTNQFNIVDFRVDPNTHSSIRFGFDSPLHKSGKNMVSTAAHNLAHGCPPIINPARSNRRAKIVR